MEKPFGTFALTKREQKARHIAAKLGASVEASPTKLNTTTPSTLDKFIRSCLWRYASGNAKRPRDITVFETQKARLHPYDNICEKRVFMTPQFWENQERAVLADHIKNHREKEFYFIDAGANVGLYTLFARSCTQKQNLALKALCIEPGETVRTRLNYNILANEAEHDIIVSPCALSDTNTHVDFNIGHGNLGESRVTQTEHTPENQKNTIQARPLHELVQDQQFRRIDALKIDIEGMEHKALNAFFQKAPKHLWPKLIIIEIAHAQSHANLKELLETNHYHPVHHHRGNMIFTLQNT